MIVIYPLYILIASEICLIEIIADCRLGKTGWIEMDIWMPLRIIVLLITAYAAGSAVALARGIEGFLLASDSMAMYIMILIAIVSTNSSAIRASSIYGSMVSLVGAPILGIDSMFYGAISMITIIAISLLAKKRSWKNSFVRPEADVFRIAWKKLRKYFLPEVVAVLTPLLVYGIIMGWI